MTFHAFLPPWLLGAIEEAGDATVILRAGDRPYVIKSDAPYHLKSAPMTALALEAIAQQILSDTAQEMLYSKGSVEVTLERQRIPVAVRAERLDNELVIRLRNPAAAIQAAPPPEPATAPASQVGTEPARTPSAPERGPDIEVDIDINLDPDADERYGNLPPHGDEGGLDEHRRQLIAALHEAASSEDIRSIIGRLASKLDVPLTGATPRANGSGKGVATTHSDADFSAIIDSDVARDPVREDLPQEQVSEAPAYEAPVHEERALAEAARDAAAPGALPPDEVETQVLSMPQMAPDPDPGTNSSRWPDLPAAIAASTPTDPVKAATSGPLADAAPSDPFFPDPIPAARPAAPAPSTLIIRRGQVPEAARRPSAEPSAKRSIFARLASKIGLSRDAALAAPAADVQQPQKAGTDRIPEKIEESKPHKPVASEPVVAQSPAARPPDPRDVPTSVGRFYARSLAQLRAAPPAGALELSSPEQRTGLADAKVDETVTPDLTAPSDPIGSTMAPLSELSVVAAGVQAPEPEPEASSEPSDASELIARADVILAPEATFVEQAAPESAELPEVSALSGETAAPELTLVSELAIVEQAAPDVADLSELSVIAEDAIAPEIIVASTLSEASEPIAIVGHTDFAETFELSAVLEESATVDLVTTPESSEAGPAATAEFVASSDAIVPEEFVAAIDAPTAPELTGAPEFTAGPDLTKPTEPPIVEQAVSEFVEISVVVDQAPRPELWPAPESSEVPEPVTTSEAEPAARSEQTAPEAFDAAIEDPLTPELTAAPELAVSPEPAIVKPPTLESAELLVPPVADGFTATAPVVDDHEPEPLAIAEPAPTQEPEAPWEAVAAFELTPPQESSGEPEPEPVLEDVAPDFAELPSLSFVDGEPASRELAEALGLEPLVADAASAFELKEPAEEVATFAAVSEQRAVAEHTSWEDVSAAGERFAGSERVELGTTTVPGFMAKLVSRIGFSRNPEVALPAAELRRRFESVVGRAQSGSRHELPGPLAAADAPMVIDVPTVEPAVQEECLETTATPQPDVVTENATLNATITPIQPETPILDAAIPEADPSPEPEPTTATEYDAVPVPVAPPELTAVNEPTMAPELRAMSETIATTEPIDHSEATSDARALVEPADPRPMTALPAATDETMFVREADARATEPSQYAESGGPGNVEQVTLEPAASVPAQEDTTEADQPEGGKWPEPMERVMRQERPKTVAALVDLGRRRALSPATADLGDWIAEAMDRSASAVYLRVGSAPFARIDGQVEALASDFVPISMFERAGAMLTAGEDGWRSGGDGEWIKYVPAMGAIRCQVFADERGGGFNVRLPGAAAGSLGNQVPRHLRAACETGDGLIVLSAPFAEDVTAMVTAVAASSVSRHPGYVVAFGTNGSLESVARNAFVSERPAPGGHHEMSVAIQAALHERPDVVIVNTSGGRIWNADAIVEAAVGRLVIVGLVARTAPRSIETLLGELGSAQARQALASVFRAACSWRGFRRSSGKMILSDVLIGTTHVAALIEEGNIAGLQQAQRDHEGGMRTLDAALGRAVTRRKITLREAAAAAVDRRELVSLVLRQARERRAAERALRSGTQRTRPATGV